MALKLITPPAPILTPDEVITRTHLRVDDDDGNELIALYIEAATQELDGYRGTAGVAIGQQTWELVLDAFPCGAIKIPFGPLISVTSVTYDDADGVAQTIAAENYYVDVEGEWVVPVSDYSWPSSLSAVNAVRVRFVAGHSEVPARMKIAVMLRAADLYRTREAAVDGSVSVNPAYAAITNSFRRFAI